MSASDLRDLRVGGLGRASAGENEARQRRDRHGADAKHAHRHEQFGQVRPGRREQDEPAADHDGAAGQELGVGDSRPDPRRELAGDETKDRERDEDQPGDEGRKTEAVAGAVRRAACGVRRAACGVCAYRVMSVSRRYMPIPPTNMARFAPATAGCRTARTSTRGVVLRSSMTAQSWPAGADRLRAGPGPASRRHR
ncbi:hypothetical protein [Streptomyces sp. NPDC127108]|uniref:hypothetical protein n=1 Tax=Streptomyces sp. NPDC127108 TaxID=3345361 RepID=UPI003644C930